MGSCQTKVSMGTVYGFFAILPAAGGRLFPLHFFISISPSPIPPSRQNSFGDLLCLFPSLIQLFLSLPHSSYLLSSFPFTFCTPILTYHSLIFHLPFVCYLPMPPLPFPICLTIMPFSCLLSFITFPVPPKGLMYKSLLLHILCLLGVSLS
ncbi:hypothetical protein ASPTUDRAFT_352962 [Aspergillus tubingensis CBS 134.48]|uniref:Uncharacterized protein n=1 Tax=Aspergillus tubingensis (strain CBS 134.48) TaxID=767770 RepID=A0A1L9NHT0_ASPTC|nr:hypothetical protein ASPTUDRAFT_352962 [Aspergillus tubingensis CBS 134.48]